MNDVPDEPADDLRDEYDLSQLRRVPDEACRHRRRLDQPDAAGITLAGAERAINFTNEIARLITDRAEVSLDPVYCPGQDFTVLRRACDALSVKLHGVPMEWTKAGEVWTGVVKST